MSKPASIHEQLTDCFKNLRLPTFRDTFAEQAEWARREELTYEEFLLELAEAEWDRRWNNRIIRNQRASKLPPEKTFETFDTGRLPRKVARRVTPLREGTFTERAENVLAFGNPGSGKTHLLAAIGHELIQQGRKVFFTPTSLLVQNLLVAKRELELENQLKKLGRFDAIIIDDIGYVQQSREEMEVLFTLLADRYERSSLMLTSNLPFSDWERIFKDPMTTAAAIDRLVHHSVILELNLPSYRLKESKAKLTAPEQSKDEPPTIPTKPSG
jgi:DNA replication protein DnaC